MDPKPFFRAPANVDLKDMSALQLFLYLGASGWKLGGKQRKKPPYRPGLGLAWLKKCWSEIVLNLYTAKGN